MASVTACWIARSAAHQGVVRDPRVAGGEAQDAQQAAVAAAASMPLAQRGDHALAPARGRAARLGSPSAMKTRKRSERTVCRQTMSPGRQLAGSCAASQERAANSRTALVVGRPAQLRLVAARAAEVEVDDVDAAARLDDAPDVLEHGGQRGQAGERRRRAGS